MKRKLWFKAKKYGWGWYPSSWEGCLVTLLYVIGIAFIFSRADFSSGFVANSLIEYMILFVFLTFALIWICLRNGEKPRWRWGN